MYLTFTFISEHCYTNSAIDMHIFDTMLHAAGIEQQSSEMINLLKLIHSMFFLTKMINRAFMRLEYLPIQGIVVLLKIEREKEILQSVD